MPTLPSTHPDATDAVAAVTAGVAKIKRRIARIENEHRKLMVTAAAELSALGVEHVIASGTGAPGDLVTVTEAYRADLGGVVKVTSYLAYDPTCSSTRKDRAEPGVWSGDPRADYRCLFNSLGLFEIAVTHAGQSLLIKVDGDHDESGHRKTIVRLRRLAAEDSLRVRLRDRAVSMLDPMGNTLHIGDALTAHAFILNLDLEEAAHA